MKTLYTGIICFMLGIIVGHGSAWNSGYMYAKHQFKRVFEIGLKEGKTFHVEGWDNLKFYPRLDRGINIKERR